MFKESDLRSRTGPPTSARHEQLQKLWKSWDEAEKPIIKDLLDNGVLVDSVWDLVPAKTDYGPAIPSLLAHLKIDYPDAIRDGIARSLAIPASFEHWDEICEEFKKTDATTMPRTKDALALCLVNSSGDRKLTEIIDLLSQPCSAGGKVFLVWHLKKYFRRENVWIALQEFENDPELGSQLVPWVQKRREKNAAETKGAKRAR